jgi:hypothetical protein
LYKKWPSQPPRWDHAGEQSAAHTEMRHYADLPWFSKICLGEIPAKIIRIPVIIPILHSSRLFIVIIPIVVCQAQIMLFTNLVSQIGSNPWSKCEPMLSSGQLENKKAPNPHSYSMLEPVWKTLMGRWSTARKSS